METVFSTDQKIINTLLLNASFIDNLGLMHGKMGISIFFFHLARQTKNKIYEDYAGELIDEIYDEITINTPVDFENGMAGIGWGIEYLVQNGFIEADTDEVLEEFDNRIFKELIYNTPKDIGLLNGLTGLGAYFLKRIQPVCRQGGIPNSNDEKISLLTNKHTLIHIIDELDRKTQNITEIISEPLFSSNNCQTLELSNNRQTFSKRSPSDKPLNNNQTLEPSNNEQQTSERQTTNKTFDLTWNYPTLLWFLAELYQQNIFNFKVEKIIQRLVEPLSDETNLPKLQSNRLLLALALTKLQQTTNEKPQTTNNKQQTSVEHSNPRTNVKPSNLLQQESYGQTAKTNLLSEINRNTIKSELPPNKATLRHGTPGIAWIYQQLHRLTGDNHFKEEVEYWLTSSYLFGPEKEFFMEDNIQNINSFGILEGFAGNLILDDLIKR